jgi:hypothetical protein
VSASSTLHALLRTEVGRFRETERRRRRFDLTVHVGELGGERESVVLPTNQAAYVDRQVRIELMSAVLEVAPGQHGWVTRPGPTELRDDDTMWLVAATGAFTAAHRALDGFYAITREGWVDVRTGERRVWKRLRLNR